MIKEFKRARNFIISFLILFFSFFIVLPFSPLRANPGYDKEVFKYVGMVIQQGGLPYHDVFDHKPPLIYLIAALGNALGIWGFWAIERLFTGFTAISFFVWLQKRGFKYSLFATIMFVTTLSIPAIYSGGGLTRNFTACSTILGILLLKSKIKGKYFVAGLIAGGTFMLQQNEILPLLGWFLTQLIITREKTGILKPFSYFVAGAILFVFPFFLFFLFTGIYQDFIYQTLSFNIMYAESGTNISSRIGHLIETMGDLAILSILLTIFCQFIFVLVYKKLQINFKEYLLPCLIALGCQVIAILVSGQLSPHYFLGLMPLLIFTWVLIMNEFEVKKFLQFFSVQLVFSILLLFSLPLGPLTDTVIEGFKELPHLTEMPGIEMGALEFEPYLYDLRGQKGQFFIFRDTPETYLNTYYQITSPSKYIYTHLYEMFSSWDSDGKEFQGILDNIKLAKTKYILDNSKNNPIRPEMQLKWDNFVRENYNLVKMVRDGEALLQLK